MKARKISVILMTAAILAGTLSMTGCGGQGAPGGSGEEVVIYSNADDEAVEAMKNGDEDVAMMRESYDQRRRFVL